LKDLDPAPLGRSAPKLDRAIIEGGTCGKRSRPGFVMGPLQPRLNRPGHQDLANGRHDAWVKQHPALSDILLSAAEFVLRLKVGLGAPQGNLDPTQGKYPIAVYPLPACAPAGGATTQSGRGRRMEAKN